MATRVQSTQRSCSHIYSQVLTPSHSDAPVFGAVWVPKNTCHSNAQLVKNLPMGHIQFVDTKTIDRQKQSTCKASGAFIDDANIADFEIDETTIERHISLRRANHRHKCRRQLSRSDDIPPVANRAADRID